MLIRINPSNQQPLFAQIVDGVKQAVGTGRVKAGDRLPSVRELAKELVINPNTIQRAYQVLESEGVTFSRRGAGTFIAERRLLVRDEERDRRLKALIEGLLTEVVHLGLTEEQLRGAFEEAVKRYRFTPQQNGGEQSGEGTDS